MIINAVHKYRVNNFYPIYKNLYRLKKTITITDIMRTIGKLAKELGLNVETIRFYERRGLIEQPEKPLNGFRQYPDATVRRIRFIKRIQELGFTLEEILFLLELNDKPCCQVQNLTREKLTSIQEKIANLQHLETALKTLLSQCQSNPDENHCPLIDALQN